MVSVRRFASYRSTNNRKYLGSGRMYGIVLGIVFGLIGKAWSFVLLMPLIHGFVMGFRKYLRKPDDIEMEVYKKMEERGTKAFSDKQEPILEFITEGILCLIAGSVTYGIKLAML